MGYVSSKAAVFGLLRQVASDLPSAGIAVNVVALGPVETPEFFRTTPEQAREGAAAVTLLKRLATPQGVVAGVSFLVSPDASYLTETTRDINDGAHMH
jgi:NAD(P)-dependent dehydrogenase (short-subunit alcohol dehydrogenase family)